MAASTREGIQAGLISRLESITSANGYDTNVVGVYGGDKIPMGLDLEDYELPAILVVAGDDELERSTQCIKGLWAFELQLIHTLVDDATMDRFVRDVAKAIFANSPTADRNEAFRGPAPNGLHKSVFDVWLRQIEPDLNMIEANRFYCCQYVVRYHTSINNL